MCGTIGAGREVSNDGIIITVIEHPFAYLAFGLALGAWSTSVADEVGLEAMLTLAAASNRPRDRPTQVLF